MSGIPPSTLGYVKSLFTSRAKVGARSSVAEHIAEQKRDLAFVQSYGNISDSMSATCISSTFGKRGATNSLIEHRSRFDDRTYRLAPCDFDKGSLFGDFGAMGTAFEPIGAQIVLKVLELDEEVYGYENCFYQMSKEDCSGGSSDVGFTGPFPKVIFGEFKTGFQQPYSKNKVREFLPLENLDQTLVALHAAGKKEVSLVVIQEVDKTPKDIAAFIATMALGTHYGGVASEGKSGNDRKFLKLQDTYTVDEITAFERENDGEDKKLLLWTIQRENFQIFVVRAEDHQVRLAALLEHAEIIRTAIKRESARGRSFLNEFDADDNDFFLVPTGTHLEQIQYSLNILDGALAKMRTTSDARASLETMIAELKARFPAYQGTSMGLECGWEKTTVGVVQGVLGAAIDVFVRPDIMTTIEEAKAHRALFIMHVRVSLGKQLPADNIRKQLGYLLGKFARGKGEDEPLKKKKKS